MPAAGAGSTSDWPVGWAQRLLPIGEALPTGPVHGSPLLPEYGLADRPYIALNMVATVDGRATIGGSSAGLGSPTDRALLHRLRAEADAVMHGAGTLRAEQFSPRVPASLSAERVRRGQPAQPLGVLVLGTNPLPVNHLYLRRASRQWPRLVYATSPLHQSLAAEGVEVIQGNGSTVDLVWLLKDLARRGIRRLVCEGGPRLSTSLLRAGLVDDLFLTLAPRLALDPSASSILDDHATEGPRSSHLTLHSVYERDGELFLRYRIDPSNSTKAVSET